MVYDGVLRNYLLLVRFVNNALGTTSNMGAVEKHQTPYNKLPEGAISKIDEESEK